MESKQNLLNFEVCRGLRTSVGVIFLYHLSYNLVRLICCREIVLKCCLAGCGERKKNQKQVHTHTKKNKHSGWEYRS